MGRTSHLSDAYDAFSSSCFYFSSLLSPMKMSLDKSGDEGSGSGFTFGSCSFLFFSENSVGLVSSSKSVGCVSSSKFVGRVSISEFVGRVDGIFSFGRVSGILKVGQIGELIRIGVLIRLTRLIRLSGMI